MAYSRMTVTTGEQLTWGRSGHKDAQSMWCELARYWCVVPSFYGDILVWQAAMVLKFIGRCINKYLFSMGAESPIGDHPLMHAWPSTKHSSTSLALGTVGQAPRVMACEGTVGTSRRIFWANRDAASGACLDKPEFKLHRESDSLLQPTRISTPGA